MTIVQYQRFETPGVSARDRFEYWRTWYSEAIDGPMRLEPVAQLPRDFGASAETLSAAGVDIVEYRFGPAEGSWDGDALEQADRLRLVLLAASPGGIGFWHGREVSLAGGAVVLIGRTDGRWHVPAGLRGIQVNAPRAATPVTDLELESINDPRRLLNDPIAARVIRPALVGIAGHLDALAGSDARALGELWISLVTMLVRSRLGHDQDGIDTATARRFQPRRYIRARLADPDLSPGAVADALHVSRRTLYAAFAAAEEGIAEEIRRQRLERAHAMLADPARPRPIAKIAAAVGFRNAAHFSRIFRAEYGANPRDVRASAEPRG